MKCMPEPMLTSGHSTFTWAIFMANWAAFGQAAAYDEIVRCLQDAIDCAHEHEFDTFEGPRVIDAVVGRGNGQYCGRCGMRFVCCDPCSEAGGAGMPVYHATPACPPEKNKVSDAVQRREGVLGDDGQAAAGDG